MAMFGTPAALEDHALRACLAALAMQDEIARLAAEVHHRDGVALRLRIGLNSGLSSSSTRLALPPGAECAFRHPLIRAVAYESQLKTRRAELHRRVAEAIEENNPDSADQNAALIAEHREAAGDLSVAFGWHMRAGAWSMSRDVAAARISWQRARQVADRLPADDPDRVAKRIAPRTLLCGTVWLAGGSVADTGFDELRELCVASADRASLAMGMAGLVLALAGHERLGDAAQQASELVALVDEIGDPALTVGLLSAAVYAKSEVGEMTEALHLAQRVIDLSDEPRRIHVLMGSPLERATRMRGLARLCLGIQGWQADFDNAVGLAASVDATSHVAAIMFNYVVAVPVGALPADAVALRETAVALRIAEQAGDDFTVAQAQLVRGLVLVHHARRKEGLQPAHPSPRCCADQGVHYERPVGCRHRDRKGKGPKRRSRRCC
jgi:adenylate cyclase